MSINSTTIIEIDGDEIPNFNDLYIEQTIHQHHYFKITQSVNYSFLKIKTMRIIDERGVQTTTL